MNVYTGAKRASGHSRKRHGELSDINDLLSTRLMLNACINNVQNGAISVRRGVLWVLPYFQDGKRIKVSQKSLKGRLNIYRKKILNRELIFLTKAVLKKITYITYIVISGFTFYFIDFKKNVVWDFNNVLSYWNNFQIKTANSKWGKLDLHSRNRFILSIIWINY